MLCLDTYHPYHTYLTYPTCRTMKAVRIPGIHFCLRPGSLLLEAIIAIGIFAIFLGGIALSLLVGERSTIVSGDRGRGAFLAEQQLEAVRQMRSTNFDSVTTGAHGVSLVGNSWAFSGTSITTNGYKTKVDVVSKGTDWLEVSSTVTWDFGNTRSGSVVLTSYLTNWRKTATVGNWSAMTRIANLSIGGTPEYQKIAVSGTYAFVTSSRASGGKGLYVFDISNPASPVRIAATFDLGASAYGIVASGNRLYLATDDPLKEVQVYDIASPATLTAGNLLKSYDLAGTGKARSVAVYGANVFIGSLDDAPNHQLTALLMSETGPMTLQSSLSMSGSVLGLMLQDGYAYVANAYNVGELQVVDIFDPTAMTFAPGVGIDLTNTQDATAIGASGTSALIGRLSGAAIDELTLYDIGPAPVPSPPPGPWTLEIGGDVNSLATVYGSKYAFVGGSADAAQLRVLDLVKFALGQAPVVKTYDALATMQGLFYDWQTDRLFGVTSDNLMIFAPG